MLMTGEEPSVTAFNFSVKSKDLSKLEFRKKFEVAKDQITKDSNIYAKTNSFLRD